MVIRVPVCPRCGFPLSGNLDVCPACEPRKAWREHGSLLIIAFGSILFIMAVVGTFVTASSGRAVIYYWQEKSAPVPPELEQCRVFAQMNNMAVGGTFFDELIDGKLVNRNVPGLAAALNTLGKNDTLLVTSPAIQQALWMGGTMPVSPEDETRPDPYADPLILQAKIAGKGARVVAVKQASKQPLFTRFGFPLCAAIGSACIILFGFTLRRWLSDKPKRRKRKRRT